MSFRSRLGAAWRGLSAKDAGTIDLTPYGSLAPFIEVYGANRSKSGHAITFATALQVSTVLACVRVLADGVAQVPLKLMRERADGGSDIAKDHPLHYLMHRRPNPWQTSFRLRETMMLHLVLCGNFFAFKNRVGNQIREIIPIEPGKVEVKQNRDFTITYSVRDDAGQKKDFPQEAILHLRGPSWNSWMGMEAVKLARESIGLSMAIEADQAQLYKNGLRTSGTYSVEGVLTDVQYAGLRKFIKEYQADEGGGPLILDRAAQYVAHTITGADAQTLESRKFQIEETCRPFRVWPIMVGHSGDSAPTFASAEQFFEAHKVHGLGPWYERLQQDFDEQLLGENESDLHFLFVQNGLVRGAFETRMSGYSQALGSGGSPAWMTPNEVRALEDMNPIEGGDELPKPPQAKPPEPPEDMVPPKDQQQ